MKLDMESFRQMHFTENIERRMVGYARRLRQKRKEVAQGNLWDRNGDQRMKIYLIRHGKTKGNLEERYIGRTDEPLCEAGRENLKKYQYPQVESMGLTSPMKRCMQTAETIYPGAAVSMHRRIKRERFRCI